MCIQGVKKVTFYPEDLSQQILNKVRHRGGYKTKQNKTKRKRVLLSWEDQTYTNEKLTRYKAVQGSCLYTATVSGIQGMVSFLGPWIVRKGFQVLS